MESKKRTTALVTAAGLSSRMGDFKPLMPIEGKPMLGRIIETFRSQGICPIIVVTGKNASLIEGYLDGLEEREDIITVYNPDYATSQMFDSVKLGMKALQGRCDQFFFVPVDIPLFSGKVLEVMLRSDCEGGIVKPSFHGKSGHPILISTALIPSLLSYEDEGGLKGAIRESRAKISFVDVEDKGILLDADTRQDYIDVQRYVSERGCINANGEIFR